jgi:hypothetical protein
MRRLWLARRPCQIRSTSRPKRYKEGMPDKLSGIIDDRIFFDFFSSHKVVVTRCLCCLGRALQLESKSGCNPWCV